MFLIAQLEKILLRAKNSHRSYGCMDEFTGHRANILNEDFDSVGIGHVSQGGKQYWVQMFGAELK